ncbi:Spectrin repeat superfamily Extracellular matrix-binding protein, putative [Babesia ovata]|uniref:Spectrin repeat superfamily Extracellular matrix-binding protein, putative n=1 Tax=Babesia ovata TaxID=189622 RepID=A0A2H6K8S1_9APIC|nr:Spectrin repeat superfamily Extracellular matrix-binding protein, putative [Babesia ovata]GBE59396.1 Spectrin repeat superfamily Extracellular matrix-binding protein, putative [Babesia ovata]
MAPKKLTDCPENLRESIDWLIQVKNGGDGSGLEKLAEALKQLIGEAIENAEKSVTHKKRKLECSPNPYDPQSYCSHLDEQIKLKNDELQKAKIDSNKSLISSLEAEIQRCKSNKDDCTKSHFMDEQRMSSLEGEVHDGIDVIVKLTQFSGSEKSIIDLINKEIKRLEKQHNTCEKSPQPHPSSDCPQHKKLEELRKKRDEISTNKNNSNCETLLNNLCSGLEKFLGYQETSKGYTGEGIVYSDLDRLCDGVMSFLHGVLDEVHTNNNLSPYKETLENAVSLLETHRHEGKTGLHTVIGTVKLGIEQWLGDVNTKSEAVKKPIKNLEDDVNAFFKYFETLKTDKEYDAEQSNLQSSIRSVNQLSLDVHHSTDALMNVDKMLEKELKPHVDLIFESVKAFKDSTKQDHDGLVKVCKKVDEEFGELDKKVEDGLSESNKNGLRYKFKEGIESILQQIGKERKGSLFHSIETALREMNETLENEEGIKGLNKVADNAGGLADTVCGGWDLLKIEITNLVNKIKGEGRTSDGVPYTNGLTQINNGIKAYALEFTSGTFVTVLTQWIGEIVDEGVVHGKIYAYVLNNGPKFQDAVGRSSEKTAEVKAAIKAKFPLHIITDIQSVAQRTLQGIKVGNVGEQFQRFVEELGMQFKGIEVENTLGVAAKAIEDHLKSTNPKLPTKDENIKQAVKAIIKPLERRFQQVANELQRFTATSQIANLTAAISNVELIGNKVDESKDAYNDGFGKKIDTALEKVKAKIQALDVLFGKTVGDEGSIHSMLKGVTTDLEALNNIKKDGSVGKINFRKNQIVVALDTIRRKIVQDINAVIKTLQVADKQLTVLLNDLSKSLTKFQETFLQEIESFHAAYKQRSSEAKNAIKRQALSQFAHSKARALEQLKELVEEQNEIILNKIHIDTETGLKGFMKIFNEKLVEKLQEIKTITPTEFTPEKSPLNQAAEKVCVGFEMFFEKLGIQRKEFEGFPPGVIQPDAMFPGVSKYESVTNALLKLLEDLHASKHFDHNFSDHLKSLNTALSTFAPAKFTDPSSLILQALKDGIGALAKQLGYAYVSTYCCQKFDGALLDPEISTASDDKRKLTEYGKMLSKVFMSCLPGWLKHLAHLKKHCDKNPKKGPWNDLKITKHGKILSVNGSRTAATTCLLMQLSQTGS